MKAKWKWKEMKEDSVRYVNYYGLYILSNNGVQESI